MAESLRDEIAEALTKAWLREHAYASNSSGLWDWVADQFAVALRATVEQAIHDDGYFEDEDVAIDAYMRAGLAALKGESDE